MEIELISLKQGLGKGKTSVINCLYQNPLCIVVYFTKENTFEIYVETSTLETITNRQFYDAADLLKLELGKRLVRHMNYSIFWRFKAMAGGCMYVVIFTINTNTANNLIYNDSYFITEALKGYCKVD